jgi:hypothetical protein
MPPAVPATLLPAPGYADWLPTKETLHRFLQIVGKLRLAASPRRNHWWNVALHLTGRGLTTRPMTVDGVRVFTVDRTCSTTAWTWPPTTGGAGRWPCPAVRSPTSTAGSSTA